MRDSGTWHGLDLGDHVCVPITDLPDRAGWLAGFAEAGLRAGQKVLFRTGEPAPAELRRRLDARLPTAGPALADGRLVVSPGADSHLPDGAFDPDLMLRELRAEIDLAGRQGHAGLRISDDLTWAGRRGVDGGALADYEARANVLFMGGRALGVCHYDPARIGPAAWQELVAAHPATVQAAGDVRLSGLSCVLTDAPTGVAVRGEVDLTNRTAWSSLLAAVVPMPGRCVIDATGLRFADARALSTLVDVAATRGERPTTLVCSPRLARLLDLVDAGRVPALSVTVGRCSGTPPGRR